MKMQLLMIGMSLVLSSCAKDLGPHGEVGAAKISQTAVFGGDDVGPNETIARTTVVIANEKEQYLCTGSLYGENFILTAAHCISDTTSNMVIHFGVNVHAPVVKRKVLAAQRSPRYNGDRIKPDSGDVGVLKYEGSLPEGFRAAKLLGDYRGLVAGTPVTAAGYGVNGATLGRGLGILRKVSLKIKDPTYSKSEMTVKQGLFKGVCDGDSGGPSFVQGGDGSLYLWGLQSSTQGVRNVRDCIGRAIFTRVDYYRSWIEETAAGL